MHTLDCDIPVLTPKAAVFTNGRIALTKDLIFGVLVMTDDGWYPVAYLNDDDKKHCAFLLDHNPTCPAEYAEALRVEAQPV